MDRPNLGTASIIRANSRHLPLADNSVDLVVTSPPYFALRSYQDGGEHYAGQIGDEPTPDEFVSSLLEVTAECVRVLKPSGSLWVNLGDKYGRGTRSTVSLGPNAKTGRGSSEQVIPTGYAKSLIGIPWRYALRCIDDLGLILRAEVIWSKPNGLPESVTDRVRRSHEQWFCFEQSGGVEAVAQSVPFCPLCGRPVDARATLVARLKEVDGGVESGDLSGHVRTDHLVDGEDAGRGDVDQTASLGRASVPVVEGSHPERVVDAVDLLQNSGVTVVDANAEDGSALAVDEGHGALAVDDSGKPADVCECVGHPLIINDEPWLPQSLSAEIMQRVADGEIDAQQAADFLAGDYARNHSVWFHFTLQPRYFSAVDEIREPHLEPDRKRADMFGGVTGTNGVRHAGASVYTGPTNPLGKLPGSVWTIPTEPLRVPDHLGIDHFAAFPTEWPKRIIQGWSPAGVCVECGEGRRPVVDRHPIPKELKEALAAKSPAKRHGDRNDGAVQYAIGGPQLSRPWRAANPETITGYACACPEPTADTTPGVVLDPFGGTGTVAMVAKALGRQGISVDMSADYCRLAEWRTNDRDQLAKVLGVAKADPVHPDETSLFDLLDGEPA